jgi:hypothetical protein
MLLAMFLVAPVLLDDQDRSSSHGPAESAGPFPLPSIQHRPLCGIISSSYVTNTSINGIFRRSALSTRI